MRNTFKGMNNIPFVCFLSVVVFLMTAPLLISVNVQKANAMFGPSRQNVTKTVVINAPPEKVWAVVKNFHDMSWHPAVEKTEGDGGNTVGAKRVLVLKGGGKVYEQLSDYSAEGMSYSYRITEVDVKVLPVTKYSSSVSVRASDAGTTVLEWKGGFFRGFPNNNPPPELNDQAAVETMSGVYLAGLEAVKKKIESGS